MSEKQAFMAGWEHGYADGGEHDCRMSVPTADSAWEHYKFLKDFNKKPLEERAKMYRCPSCLSSVEVKGVMLHCKSKCRWGTPFSDPVTTAKVSGAK